MIIQALKYSLGSLGALVSFLLFRYYLMKRRIEKQTNIPVTFPLIKILMKEEALVLGELQKTHGDLFISSFGFINIVNVSSAHITQMILKDPVLFQKGLPPVSKTISDFIGVNIFNANGSTYERHKQVFSKTLTFSSIENMVPTFVRLTQKFIHRIEAVENLNKFDIGPWFTKITLDVLGETLLGFEFNSMEGQQKEYVDAYFIFMENASNPIYNIITSIDNYPLQIVKDLRYSIVKLREIFRIVVDKALEERKKGIKSSNPSLLQMAIESVYCDSPIISEEEFLSDMVIFYMAGHETTSTSLSWAIHLLSQNPEVQERLYQEVYQVLNGRQPEMEDLKNMPYLNRTIKEVMRFEPAVFRLPTRVATEEFHVPDTDYVIPKDSVISLSVKNIHRDPRYWTDPEKFDPDRFLPENSKGRHPYSYLPFSLGKRMCIGSQFSIVEQQIVISMLVQKYKLVGFEKDLKKKRGNLNIPAQVPVRFVRRDNNCCY